jgi:flagellar hook protein FlgE
VSSILSIAQSGLQVASLRLAVSANNVANALTDGFAPSRVEAQEAPSGGVEGAVVKQNDPQFEAQVDRAILGASGTDLIQESVNQLLAASLFQANLATLKTTDETIGVLLDLRGS